LVRGSAAVVDDLVQRYPGEMILEQLRELYRAEIDWVIREIYRLLPDYRSRVDGETYSCDRAKLMLVRAYLCSAPMTVESLETSLKYLLKQQQLFAGALNEDA